MASTSVVDFRKVARAAHTIPDAAAYSAARLTGDPREARTVSTAVTPPQVSSAGSHASAVASGWPPLGSAMIKKMARPADVTDADAQAAGATRRPNHKDPITSENTSSLTRIDCTTDSCPL